MINKTGLAATMLAVLATIPPAAATGSLTCDADDRSISVRVLAAIGHAGSFNAPTAEAVIKSQGPGAKPVELADEHLVGRWATGRDVRLRFFRAEPGYVVDLTIETRGKKDDEERRPGTYRLEFTDSPPGKEPTTIKQNGRASCRIS